MSRGWWEFGSYSGESGAELVTRYIECAFCGEEGNWEPYTHSARSNGHGKKLNYDIYKCVDCGNLTQVFWSGGNSLHDYHQMPWPRRTRSFPKHWPEDVGRYWLQAQRNIDASNWDAAALMARSALQLLLRHEQASGRTLQKEIDDLASKGELPPIIVEWSHDIRLLGNEAAHPKPGSEGVTQEEARDVVKFLRVLLTLMHDLPKEIADFRAQRVKAQI